MSYVWVVGKILRGYNPLVANIEALAQWAKVIGGLAEGKLDLRGDHWVNEELGAADPLGWLALSPWFQERGWYLHWGEADEYYPQLHGRPAGEHPGRSLGVFLFPGLAGLGLEVCRPVQQILYGCNYGDGESPVTREQVVGRINALLVAVLFDAYNANAREV